MFKVFVFMNLLFFCLSVKGQIQWVNADAGYGPLPKGFHVFKTNDSLDGKPFVAYYAIAQLKNKKLIFSADTTLKRRLTPAEFYEKNGRPLLVVNCTFFSFATHQNLNTVIKNGSLVGFNIHSIPMKGKDTFLYRHPFGSALGISKKSNADIAWLYTDSLNKYAYGSQMPVEATKYSLTKILFTATAKPAGPFKKWNMQSAVGGGPVLVQNGEVKITNNEELKFTGKAIRDQHPRTLIGYTKANKLIIMVVQGRAPGVAEGANLLQEAKLMRDLGCVEALNLDGGGSSCMLINGKETITPSDKGLQRAVPAVFLISKRR
jgi:hypothetical protein